MTEAELFELFDAGPGAHPHVDVYGADELRALAEVGELDRLFNIWTSPRTWVTSEVVTAATMNTHVRDNLAALERVLDRDMTDATVANTVTETSVYLKTIPANTIGATGSLRIVIAGQTTRGQTSGSLTGRLKFGGTTLSSGLIGGYGGGTGSNDSLLIEIWIHNVTASTQKWHHNTHGAAYGSNPAASARGSSSIDTTISRDLEVTMQWSAASSDRSVTIEAVTLELIPVAV